MAKTLISIKENLGVKVIRVQRGRSRKDTSEAKVLIGGREIGKVTLDENSQLQLELLDGVEVELVT